MSLRPSPGLPVPSMRKRNDHASKPKAYTHFMPLRLSDIPTKSMHTASEICEREKSMVALPEAREPAYSAMPEKWVMKGVAKPLEICRQTPEKITNIRNTAISRFPNIMRNDRASDMSVFFESSLPILFSRRGNDKAERDVMIPITPLHISCMALY